MASRAFIQFLKFSIVGGFSTLINYLTFFVCIKYLSLNYLVAASRGFLLGAIIGFIFNKNFTYNSKIMVFTSFPVYIAVYAFSLFINIIFLRYFVESLRMSPVVANALLVPFIVFLNFLGTKIIVIKKRE